MLQNTFTCTQFKIPRTLTYLLRRKNSKANSQSCVSDMKIVHRIRNKRF